METAASEARPFIGQGLRPPLRPESPPYAPHDPVMPSAELMARALALLGMTRDQWCASRPGAGDGKVWQRVYKPASGLACASLDNEIILVSPESRSSFTLNRLGAVIWQWLDGGRTLEEIVRIILENYHVDDACLRRDVLSFIREMEANALLVTVE